MASYLVKLLYLFAILAGIHGAHADDLAAFVKTAGNQFTLNGSPYLFNGFNAYWMMNVATDVGARSKVSSVFQQAAAAGLAICRTWAFSDGGSGSLQVSPGVYDETVFQALDFVVSEARKNNVRLILSFVNNYNDYGGRRQYVQWAKAAGSQANSDDDFYTDPTVKTYYKNHVTKVVTRINTITKIAYKDDPTIMAWELMNEPRCQADYSGKTVNTWVQEMAPFVKTLDTNHLLEVGMEGFYGDSMPERKQVNPGYQVGTDFITNHLVPEIDFATIHAYSDAWLPGKGEADQIQFMDQWMSNHAQDSKTILKKPLVLSEFGLSSRDSGYTLDERNTYINDVYNLVDKLAKNGEMSGSMVWQLMAEGMDAYHDGYEIVLSDAPSTAKVIASESHSLNALGVTDGVGTDSTTVQRGRMNMDVGVGKRSNGSGPWKNKPRRGLNGRA